MRQELHDQTETCECAGEFDGNGVSFRWMKLTFHIPQAGWALADLRQLRKDGGVLLDLPNEMMAAAAQYVLRFNAVISQKLLDCFCNRPLNRKDALWIDKRLHRVVEVDVFDVEICD